MKEFSPFNFARNTVAAIVLVTAVPMPQPNPNEFSQLFAACLETRDPNSDECFRAQQASGLSPEDFLAKLMRKLDPQSEPPKQPKPEQPKPEARPDVWGFMKECAVSHDVDSEGCHRFFESGNFTADEVARLAERLSPVAPDTSTTSKAVGTTEGVKSCVAMRTTLNGKSAKELMEQADKMYGLCTRVSH